MFKNKYPEKMKTDKNIESQLEKLKSAYEVPNDYFQKLEKKMLKQPEVRKSYHIKHYASKLMLAAGLILLISLGYMKFSDYSKVSITSQPDSLQVSKAVNVSPLDGISDDEILEYLDDNMDIDDIELTEDSNF